MPLERIDSYFNGAVESYDERLKRSAEDEDGYIRRTAEFFPKTEHLHILDIGIGTGTGLTAILEQNPTIYVDGIDCADKMLSEIPKNLPEHKERIRTICGDFFKYELEPESYDGAVSMMALHYYSREENLELFHRVCRSIKKGGFFLLSDKFAPTQMYEDFAVPSLSRSARSSICRQTSITIALRRSMWRAKRRCFSKRALQRYACAGRNPTRQCFLPQNKQIAVEKPVELRTDKRYAS